MLRVSTSDNGMEKWLAYGRRLAISFADFVEHHQKFILILYSLLFFLVAEFQSAAKLLWFDELATYLPAKLSLADLLAFFREGLDVHSPLPSLIVKGVIAVAGDGLMTVRLPFILSFLLMSLCIYKFVSRRCPAVYAVAAMVFPAISTTFFYATEVRGYAVLLGMTGIALLCWQSASDGRRHILSSVGLFVALSLAILSHYDAVFIWIPLGLAELTKARDRRKVDWPVVFALILSAWPLLVLLPSIRTARDAYAATLYIKPSVTLSGVTTVYGDLMSYSLLPVLGTVALWLTLRKPGPLPADKPVHVPLAEWVLIGSLALLPVYALPLSLLAGAFSSHYVLPTIVGAAIFFAFGLARALDRDRLAGSVLAVVFLGWFCIRGQSTVWAGIRTGQGARASVQESYRRQGWMRELAASSLPIAATNPTFFLQLQFYAPPTIRSRLVYPVSRKYAMELDGADTGDLNMMQFSRRLPVRVMEYNAFVAGNPHFLLCAYTAWHSWQVEKLLKDGASLRLCMREGPVYVFEVDYHASDAALGQSHK